MLSWLFRRKKKGQEKENSDVVDEVVDVLMEGFNEARESVKDMFDEIKDVVDESVDDAIVEMKDVIEEMEKEGSKKVKADFNEAEFEQWKRDYEKRLQYLYGYTPDPEKAFEEDFRALLRTLLHMPEDNPQLCRELGRRGLEELQLRYNIPDEDMYVAKRLIEGVAEAQEERIRLRPIVDEKLKKEYPWLFEDDDEYYR